MLYYEKPMKLKQTVSESHPEMFGLFTRESKRFSFTTERKIHRFFH